MAQDRRDRRAGRNQMPQSLTIPQETVISLRMDEELSSATSRVGDKFTATVSIPVYVKGEMAVPAGSTVEGHITLVTQARRMNKSGMIAIEFDELILPDGRRVKVSGTLTSDDPETRRKIDDENRVSGRNEEKTVVFVGGGGVLGAILGGITGGGKGAAIGGAVGVAAGVVGILMSKGEDARVPRGTQFGLQLKDSLTIPGENFSPENHPDKVSTHQDDPPPSIRQKDKDADADPRPPIDRPERKTDAAPTVETRKDQPESYNETHESSDKTSDGKAEPEPALESAEMIRRAQEALRDQGYYEGAIDGVMSPRTATALKTFQRENGLAETGDLDPATVKKLGITGAAKPASSPRTQTSASNRTQPAEGSELALVISATADRMSDGSIHILIATRAASGGWRWFGEHIINGDTLEVYARAVRPTGPATQASSRGQIDLRISEQVEFVRRVVVHGSGDDVVIDLVKKAATAATPIRSDSGSVILKQAEDLLARFQQSVGIRSATDEVGGKLDEADTEVLFALDGFVNAARLYSRFASSHRDREQLRVAILSLAREARRTDAVVTTTSSRAANMLSTRWDPIRQEVLKLMQAHGIKTADLDN